MAKLDPDKLKEILPGPKETKRPGVAAPNISVEGSYVEFTENNIHVREVRHVTGLDPANAHLSALLADGIPNPLLGHTHAVFHNMPCTRSHAELPDESATRTVKVTSEFGFPDARGLYYGIIPNDRAEPDIEVGTALTTLQTNLHYNSEGQRVPIVLQQEFTIDLPDLPSYEELVKISPIVEMQRPMTTFMYRRLENWPRRTGLNRGKTPADLARLFVGTLNRLMIFGDPIHSWMCTGIVGVRDMQHTAWVAMVTYTFQFNPDTWRVPVSILDENGYPRTDATYVPWTEHLGNIPDECGRTEVRIAPQRDFFELELLF